MERGVYFDGWFKHNYCYHPSLPLRSSQMLEDLEKYHATVLAWAGDELIATGAARAKLEEFCAYTRKFQK